MTVVYAYVRVHVHVVDVVWDKEMPFRIPINSKKMNSAHLRMRADLVHVAMGCANPSRDLDLSRDKLTAIGYLYPSSLVWFA